MFRLEVFSHSNAWLPNGTATWQQCNLGPATPPRRCSWDGQKRAWQTPRSGIGPSANIKRGITASMNLSHWVTQIISQISQISRLSHFNDVNDINWNIFGFMSSPLLTVMATLKYPARTKRIYIYTYLNTNPPRLSQCLREISTI